MTISRAVAFGNRSSGGWGIFDRASTAQKAVDFPIAALILTVPLFMGGRGAVGQFALTLVICLGALAWSLPKLLDNRFWLRFSGVEWLLALGALVVVAQLLPLATSTLLTISPTITELLPLWIPGSGSWQMGTWQTISLTPEATRGCLVIYAAYCLFFLTLLQRLDTLADIVRVLNLVAAAAIVMGSVGLAQFFSGTTKFLWLYEHPSRTACEVVRGTFQNENHFAHFLALGIGPLIWWLCRHKEQTKTRVKDGPSGRTGGRHRPEPVKRHSVRLILTACVLVVVLAGLLTFSRGGVLILIFALLITLSVLLYARLMNRHVGIALGLVAAANISALLIFGYDSLTVELQTVTHSTSFSQLFRGRTELWAAAWEGIGRFFWTGTGIGSFREIYPIFMEENHQVEYTHGESGYLPLLLEGGVFGLALMLCGIAITSYWCVRTAVDARMLSDSRTKTTLCGCLCAVVPSLMISVVHSIADFVWYIPACMVLTITQLACACRLHQLARQFRQSGTEREHLTERYGSCTAPRIMAFATVLAVFTISIPMLQNRLQPALAARPWTSYLKQSTARDNATRSSLSQEMDRLAMMERLLLDVLHKDPGNSRAHIRLAAVYLKQFDLAQRNSENPMDLSQIRDAALASRFPTKRAQDAWLKVALGENRELLFQALQHSQRGVVLSPLEGLGYLQLSELSFLQSPKQALKDLFINQAVRVRPHHGQVLFVRGKEAALAGDVSAAFTYWQRAFHSDPDVRQVITDTLADQIPVELFLSAFSPDTVSLGALFDQFAGKDQREKAAQVAQHYVAALCDDARASDGERAARHWSHAHEIYCWLQDFGQALECQRRAVENAPSDLEYRLALARVLAKNHAFPEAVEHFGWCLRRCPDNTDLRKELANVKLQHLEHLNSRTANQADSVPGLVN